MVRRAWSMVWAMPLLLCAACNDAGGGDGAGASATASGAAVDGGADSKLSPLERVQQAELGRRQGQVRPEDHSSRDVVLRRAAARALARIGGPDAYDPLLRALSDDDGQVVAWAAYGLGYWCKWHREPTVSALVAASSRYGPSADRKRVDGGAADRLDPWAAIARAVGRCGGLQSEATLVAWLRQPPEYALPAIFALGDLATRKQRLREETFVALLKLAAGDAARPPVPEALYPFGRVAHLPPSVVERTFEVAKKRLADKGAARIHAVNALSRADEPAVAPLVEVLRGAEDYTAAERAQAARGLGQLGRPGQKALHGLLPDLIPPTGAVQATTMIADDFGVLLAVIRSLDSVGSSAGRLRQLANRTALTELPRAIRLRVSLLRCSAAQLLAERDFASKLLVECDVTDPKQPAPGPLARQAIVAAIGMPGAKFKKGRRAAWRKYAQGKDLRARQAAIQLISDHPEIKDAAEVLAAALRSDSPGVVSAAAQVIAKVPARAGKGKEGKPHPDIVAMLLDRLNGQGPTADIEAAVAVVDAVGALVLDQARPQLRKLCRSPWPTMRKHAQRALSTVLGGPDKVRCNPPAEGRALPKELEKLATEPVTLKLDTDVGELGLTLNPSHAPVAVSRVVELARAGFYRGMPVHRVVPGFVAQFGSPSGDGYGAGERPALPCETSPARFGPLMVGMALAGRDTGGTQIFITHASQPHLDGQYAWLGTASGPWAALVEGDRIQGIVVEP